MATPHVAGALALYLQTNPTASAATATQALLANTTPNKVTEPGHRVAQPAALLRLRGSAAGRHDAADDVDHVPANGATVSGTVTVSANASDTVGVTRVELYADGSLVGSDTSSPYSVAWNTATVANGGHSLQTRAYDAAGNIGSSVAVGVTVSNAGGGGELIVNGGFEGSSSPWTLAGAAFWSTGGNHHSGTGYTMLGAYNNASGSEYQTVSIPAGHPANLTFWLNVTTSESLSTAYDFFYVEVRNTSGRAARHARQLQQPQRDASPASYTQRSFSLATWRGQSVRLQFRARPTSRCRRASASTTSR